MSGGRPDPTSVAPGQTAPAPAAPGASPPTVPAAPIAPPGGSDSHGPAEASGSPLPPEVAVQVGHVLGEVQSGEEQLAQAYRLMTDRHSRDPELRDLLPLVAGWATAHAEAIDAFGERYRIVPSEGPERLRSALLSGTRVGGHGLILDLQDLLTLANRVQTGWVVVAQAGKELRDAPLGSLAADAIEQTDRAMGFLRTKLQHVAPQALTVPVAPAAELAASVPQRPTIAGIPDPVWGPLASAGLIALAAIGGLMAGRPWLVPSLGPTAGLVALSPSQPEARAWNAAVGHLGGLLAGFAAVFVTGAASAPVVLVAKIITPERALAAVLAVGLTVAVGIALRASHPPALATTLLVALGSIATLADALSLAAGVAIVVIAGELLRRLRLRGLPAHEEPRPLPSVTSRIRLEGRP